MTYLSQHINSNKQVINNNHVVFVARLQSLIQIQNRYKKVICVLCGLP